ncbi:hypothetical protein [Bradyrhizobium sp. URHC0002]
MDEMTRGISNWMWPLELPNRIQNERVKTARHALALDELTIPCCGPNGSRATLRSRFSQRSMARSLSTSGSLACTSLNRRPPGARL